MKMIPVRINLKNSNKIALNAAFSVEFSAAIAVLFSPVTFAAKVILLYLYLVNKLLYCQSTLTAVALTNNTQE